MAQSTPGDDRKAGKATPDPDSKNNPGRTPGKAEGSEQEVNQALRKDQKRTPR